MLDHPTTGNIFFNKKKVENWNRDEILTFRRTYVGFVFQNSNLFPNLTVFQNLKLALHYSNLKKNQKEDLIQKYLEEIGLKHKSESLPEELSGGERQRVAVASALIKEPHLFIADEPTAELDMENKENVIRLIFKMKELNTKTCIIIASHDSIFEDMIENTILIRDGLKIQEEKRLASDMVKNVSPERKLPEKIENILTCPRCKSTFIKKFFNEEKQMWIEDMKAVGIGTIYCEECKFDLTDEFVFFSLEKKSTSR
ncbi:ATP-binding cassette domain-containing protein [Candidatus Bathyarchaeota archaeon]|nr:ATP-binding cassette domain-containing protein [Candidatus Bathyarchaeota archaeon]